MQRVLLLPLLALLIPGFSATGQAPLPSFDSASVRPFQVPATGWAWGKPKMDPEHFSIPGAPLRFIILQAYGLDDYQLTGLPDWAAKQFYTITATTAAPATPDQMLLMLQQLLAQRFQLKVETISKLQPVWAIVAAPGGPKLRPLPPGQSCARGISGADMKAAGAPRLAMSSYNGCSMDDLVKAFNRPGNRRTLGRPVVDHTGIQGHYTMLVWQSYSGRQQEGRGFRMLDLETFREAVEKELGLKLVPAEQTLRFVQVLKVEQPGPN